MRHLIARTSTLFLLSIGTAYAGHGGGGHGGGGHGGGGGGAVVVRDHRSAPAPVVRDHRSAPAVRDHRGEPVRAVRAANGRYVFPGGVVRVVNRPVIRAHYYDVRVRPAMIVETYEPVSGYVWVGGNWRWSGAEWVWVPGYFTVDSGVSISAGITIQ